MNRSRRTRAPFLVVSLGGLLALAAAQLGLLAEPAASRPAAKARDEAPRKSGPRRPLVSEMLSFDYAALPLMTNAPTAPCANYPPRVDGHEAPPATTRASSWSVAYAGKDSTLRIGGVHVASDASLYSNPLSRSRPGVPRFEWHMLDRSTLSDEQATISRCVLDRAAIAAEQVTAAGLVPGWIYAYRRCTAGCQAPLDSAARVEQIEIITSPAVWIMSTGWATSRPVDGDPDTFSRAEAPVELGSSATIVAQIPHVPRFGPAARPLTSSSVKEGTVAFEIEVERPVGAAPEVRVFSGRVEGALDQIAGRPGFAR